MDKEHKKVVREGKQLKKNSARSGRKTRNSIQEKGIDDVLAALHLLSNSSGEGDSSHKDSGEDNGIPSKKIQKKIMLHARNVVLGMAVALKSGFAVTGVACAHDSAKSVLVLKED